MTVVQVGAGFLYLLFKWFSSRKAGKAKIMLLSPPLASYNVQDENLKKNQNASCKIDNNLKENVRTVL